MSIHGSSRKAIPPFLTSFTATYLPGKKYARLLQVGKIFTDNNTPSDTSDNYEAPAGCRSHSRSAHLADGLLFNGNSLKGFNGYHRYLRPRRQTLWWWSLRQCPPEAAGTSVCLLSFSLSSVSYKYVMGRWPSHLPKAIYPLVHSNTKYAECKFQIHYI